MTDGHHRAAIAERAARAGGAVARELFRTDLDVETKDNKNDLVTAADRDAQQQVVATVREEFPDDRFVCEEDEADLAGPESDDEGAAYVEEVPETGACWVVDPIDGTSNYVRGSKTWTTSVAAVVDGETAGSATYLPALGDLYAAGPDTVTRDGESLSVSERDDPETFLVAPVGWWAGPERGEFGALCRSLVETFGDIRRLGSFQTTLASVADGTLDAAVCTQPAHVWDTLAGVHLVRRAGGTVTDLDGEPWAFDGEGLVASNGEAHERVVEAARAARDATADPA